MDYYPTAEILAEQRFGFGPRLNQPRVTSVSEQLLASTYTSAAVIDLPSTAATLNDIAEFNKKRRQLKQSPEKRREVQKQLNQYFNQSYMAQMAARSEQTRRTPYGFQERLIQFWGNHFAISADTRRVKPIVAGVENEVIRKHWNGNFVDMLVDVTKHPTMLMFLDNHISIGPNSKVGKKRGKGLNENLAREILELHTLGVSSSYTQQDVENLAKAITGWGVKFAQPNAGFRFSAGTHEPGSVTVFGTRYSQSGVRQGENCLRDLALHPDTAKHLVTKLTMHFIGDTPSELVDELSKIYLKFEGELTPVYQVLVEHMASNSPKSVRFRTPQEWLFAVLRSSGVSVPDNVNLLRTLGQPPFVAGSPAGWSDSDKDYNSPSSLVQRWQIANNLAAATIKQARKRGGKPDQLVKDIVANLYGSDIDQHTQVALEKADGLAMKLSLLWLSPQFQYR
ncbi:DUF1800 domain-containing protein [Vibrio paucivorans]